jgi:hypothetical protein
VNIEECRAVLVGLESTITQKNSGDLQDSKQERHVLNPGLTTAEEGVAVLESFYPQDLILPRVKFLLQEMFPEAPHLPRDNGLSL